MIDGEVLHAIEVLAKRLGRRCWSETPEDLVQDGIVLVLELYKKNPNADKEWIYKALHNFFSSKSKKIRNYEYRSRSKLEDYPEVADIERVEEEEIDDVELEIVRSLVESGFTKQDILKMTGISERTLYNKLRKKRDQDNQ